MPQPLPLASKKTDKASVAEKRCMIMANANCPSGDPNASPKHANGHASPLDLIRRLNRLQSERVEGYGHFEEAFTSFVNNAPEYDFDSYKLRVAEITVSFKRISEEIIHIKNSLRDTHNQADISAVIEKMQDLEETKLKTTADYQIARKNLSEQPQDENLQQEVLNMKQKLDSLAEEISEALEDLKYECEDLYSQEADEDSLR